MRRGAPVNRVAYARLAYAVSPVTASKPATGGEILTIIVSGLGLDSEVLYAGGYPNTSNWYQVNFRVPSGIPSGMAK